MAATLAAPVVKAVASSLLSGSPSPNSIGSNRQSPQNHYLKTNTYDLDNNCVIVTIAALRSMTTETLCDFIARCVLQPPDASPLPPDLEKLAHLREQANNVCDYFGIVKYISEKLDGPTRVSTTEWIVSLFPNGHFVSFVGKQRVVMNGGLPFGPAKKAFGLSYQPSGQESGHCAMGYRDASVGLRITDFQKHQNGIESTALVMGKELLEVFWWD